MKTQTVLAIALMMPACAAGPLPGDADARAYRRLNERIEATENFRHLQRACNAMGGAVVLLRDSGGRVPPTAAELRSATCSLRSGATLSF